MVYPNYGQNYQTPYNFQYIPTPMPYPAQLQQPMQQLPQNQSTVQSPQIAQFIWVQNKVAALAYQLRPGEKVLFMDSEAPYMYAREADQNGKPLPMVMYRLVEEHEDTEEPAQMPDMSAYVTRADIASIIAETVEKEVSQRISEITLKPATSSRKKGDE